MNHNKLSLNCTCPKCSNKRAQPQSSTAASQAFVEPLASSTPIAKPLTEPTQAHRTYQSRVFYNSSLPLGDRSQSPSNRPNKRSHTDANLNVNSKPSKKRNISSGQLSAAIEISSDEDVGHSGNGSAATNTGQAGTSTMAVQQPIPRKYCSSDSEFTDDDPTPAVAKARHLEATIRAMEDAAARRNAAQQQSSYNSDFDTKRQHNSTRDYVPATTSEDSHSVQDDREQTISSEGSDIEPNKKKNQRNPKRNYVAATSAEDSDVVEPEKPKHRNAKHRKTDKQSPKRTHDSSDDSETNCKKSKKATVQPAKKAKISSVQLRTALDLVNAKNKKTDDKSPNCTNDPPDDPREPEKLKKDAATVKPAKKPSRTSRFKRQKGVKPEDQQSQDHLTCVKLKLMTILLDEHAADIAAQISATSIKATKLASLASLLMLAKVNQLVNDAEFFRMVPEEVVKDAFFEVLNPNRNMQGRARVRTVQFEIGNFFALAAQHNITLPENNYMGNMFKYLYQGYCDNFRVNIVTHARHRMQQFFNTFDDVTETDRKRTVKFLFNPSSRVQPCRVLQDRLHQLPITSVQYDFYTRGSLAAYLNDKKWWQLVPLYIFIQRAVEAHNMQYAQLWRDEDNDKKEGKKKQKKRPPIESKNRPKRVRPMRIVPLCKYRRQHIRIDSYGLYKLLAPLKLVPRQANKPGRAITENDFHFRHEEMWGRFFDMSKIANIQNRHQLKQRFHYQIETDGVSATLVYQRSDRSTDANRIKRIRDKYNNGDYKYSVGIDVGFNTYLAAVRQSTEKNASGKSPAVEKNFSLKSKRFHRNTWNNVRKKKFVHLASGYEAEAAADRNRFPPGQISPHGVNYWLYIEHCMRFFEAGIAVYCEKSYAKMAFDKYSRTQHTLSTLTKNIVSNSPSLLLIGGAEFSSNSPIKGHVRCPGIRKITKLLTNHRGCDFLFVDEYNTSRHCAKCFERFPDESRHHRVKVCRQCQPLAFMQPSIVQCKKSNREFQQQRRETPGISRKKVVQTKATAATTVWHRDIVAAKLILYKGLAALNNHPMNNNVIRPNNANDDDDDAPRNVIW